MKIKASLFIFLCVAPSFSFAATDSFTRTLRVGMRGEDVRMLQTFLNKDSETQVSIYGAGAPGKETDYFGPATARALKKFQEKYRGEILTPAGLISGTGVFAARTRAKVLALQLKASSPVSVSAPIVQKTMPAVVPAPARSPILGNLSTYSGEAGSKLEIAGENFATKNTVYFGSFEIKDVLSKDGISVALDVPALSPGVYSVYVGHEKGKNTEDRIFAITKKGAVAPKVESISPARATRGGAIIIRGSGFAQNNTIRTTVGDFPSTLLGDGTLSVSIPSSAMSFVVSKTKKIPISAYVYVVNENGVSNAMSFTLEL